VWRQGQQELTTTQQFQKISGTLAEGGRLSPITDGGMRGDQLAFVAGGAEYRGRVTGDRIEGTVTAAGRATPWSLTRTPPQVRPGQSAP
jgi:hypothetical protein